jgi:hypothetical protein
MMGKHPTKTQDYIMSYAAEPLEQRFNRKISIDPSGCHLWMANKNNKGYGMIREGGVKPKILAHRVSYSLNVGEIPAGLHVLHSCDTPACVNPAHLFLGTHAENMADKEAKGRSNHKAKSNAGSSHAQSKLTEADIPIIRELFANGLLLRDIAKRFGVAKATIGGVTGGFSWKHVK